MTNSELKDELETTLDELKVEIAQFKEWGNHAEAARLLQSKASVLKNLTEMQLVNA